MPHHTSHTSHTTRHTTHTSCHPSHNRVVSGTAWVIRWRFLGGPRPIWEVAASSKDWKSLNLTLSIVSCYGGAHELAWEKNVTIWLLQRGARLDMFEEVKPAYFWWICCWHWVWFWGPFSASQTAHPVMFQVMYVVCLLMRSMLRSNVWKLKLLRLRKIFLFCLIPTICRHLNLLFLSIIRSDSCFVTLLRETHVNILGVHPFLLWLVITLARVRLQLIGFSRHNADTKWSVSLVTGTTVVQPHSLAGDKYRLCRIR